MVKAQGQAERMCRDQSQTHPIDHLKSKLHTANCLWGLAVICDWSDVDGGMMSRKRNYKAGLDCLQYHSQATGEVRRRGPEDLSQGYSGDWGRLGLPSELAQGLV